MLRPLKSAAAAVLALCGLSSLALFAPGIATKARADTASELDELSKASDTPSGGIALARSQIAADELLEAMATLERVLMNDPDNLDARALHAGLLCRVDDKRGAIMEFDTLRGLEVPQEISDEAREPCRTGG